MGRLKQAASVFVAAGLAAVAGWSTTRGGEAQTTDPIVPAPIPPTPIPEPIPGGPTYNSLDVHLALAQEIPGFGGYFWDPQRDRLQVYLMNPEAETALLIAKLTQWFGEHPAIGPNIASRIDVLPGQYNFAVLEEWKVLARPVLLIGMELTDANEGRNRVDIGITNLDLQAEIEQVLQTPAFRLRRRFSVSSGLLRWIWVIPRRTEWAVLPSTTQATGVCSHGFHATVGGQTGFVTAAHCTPEIGNVDNSQFYQPNNSNSSWRIGVEAVDPPKIPGQGSGVCTPIGVYCRYSDAAWIRYDPLVTYKWGHIADPQSGNTWDGTEFYRIVEVLGVDQCRSVRMTGKSSGTSTGVVTRTWIDHPSGSEPPLVMLYQHQANYDRMSGDSGGPVF